MASNAPQPGGEVRALESVSSETMNMLAKVWLRQLKMARHLSGAETKSRSW